MAWATVVRGKNSKKKSQVPEKLIQKLNPSSDLINKFNEQERRTQVLRKLPHSTTTASIITDIKGQIQVPIDQVVEAVVQDSLDRRRFYVRFRTVESKREVARRGYKVNGIDIPPEKADVSGYIPDVPHYMDQEDIIQILSLYGEVTSGKFRTFEGTGIRCGGFDFELNLGAGKKKPSIIQILNDEFRVHLKDDLRQCNYCDKFGHRRRECRKRSQDLLQKANTELLQQMGETLDETNEGRQSQHDREQEELHLRQHQEEQERLQHATEQPPAVHHLDLNEPPKGVLAKPTPTKRSTPENGHSSSQIIKRSAITSLYEQILQDLPSEDDMIIEDARKEAETEVVDEDRYNYYVVQRKAFAKQASSEAVAQYYPSQSPSQLTEEEWGMIQPHINSKFRELLVDAFPLDHLHMNNIYLNRRKTS